MRDFSGTCGEWVVQHDDINKHGNIVGIFIGKKNEGVICEAFSNCLVSDEKEMMANAALISSSLDMFNALRNAEVTLGRIKFCIANERHETLTKMLNKIDVDIQESRKALEKALAA